LSRVDFEALVSAHRRELYVHCYRMLGSVQDAEDAVQESLLAAWKGKDTFEGRSTPRAWLYRICTNVCLRMIERRPARMLSPSYGPPFDDPADLGSPVLEPVWIEPLPDPAEAYERRETVTLAFVAALQRLPGTQRAVLLLRDVLRFSAAETASLLSTSTASVNSALQRARAAVSDAPPDAAAAPAEPADVAAFVAAWEAADIPALLALLTADARFTMPPLPAWFDGREAVGRFLAGRLFAERWRLVPYPVNGQTGFLCYMGPSFGLGAINVLTVRDGLICEITGFLDPALHRFLGVPLEFPESSGAPR
jgi:RNA polymerase sigma-70 factor (TIGR02960 family)